MTTPEKNKTGKPRPPGPDVAEKQVDTTMSTFDDALDRTTERLRRKVETPAPLGSATPSGDTYKVTLAAGGTVTLTVSVSHFALSKHRGDRDFVNGLIDALTDYGAGTCGTAGNRRYNEPPIQR